MSSLWISFWALLLSSRCYGDNKLATNQPPFSLNPADRYDEYYVSTVRKNFDAFHENLSRANYSGNGLLVAEDVHWNYDGNLIIGRDDWVTALTTVVNGSLRGLYIPDLYQVMDGNVGAVLYRLQGNQSGPFAGLPLTPGAHFHVAGAELAVFNSEALLYDLISIEPIGQMVRQMSGQLEVPAPTPQGTQPLRNLQMPPSYREEIRQTLKQFHVNVNAGNASANRMSAIENVVVDVNGNVTKGRDAFLAAIGSTSAGEGAFPNKIFHDDYVLADGRLGAIEYIWHGRQTKNYGNIAANNTLVRMRGMVFFEFNEDLKVEKLTSVYDEAVVATQLQGLVQYLYP